MAAPLDDAFEGWIMADVGCHWSRLLANGRMAYLSTYSWGQQSGYSLTINFDTIRYDTLDAALADPRLAMTIGGK